MTSAQQLPIDIPFQKLTETLIDRKKLSLKWQDSIKKIRSDIDIALDSVLDNKKIKELAEGKCVNYFVCKEILNLLQESDEGKTKNFFGNYDSPKIRAWSSILSSYEKNNVYLGEISRILIQNTSYEIPCLKKTIQQSQKQMDDNNRKIGDYKKGIAETKRVLSTMCKKMNIQGEDFRKELENLCSELPHYFKEIEEEIQGEEFRSCLEYYNAFQEFIHGYAPEENKVIKGISKKQGKNTGKKAKQESSFSKLDEMESPLVAINEFLAADEQEKLKEEVDEKIEEIAQVNWDIPTDVCFEIDSTEWNITEQLEEQDQEIQWDITIEDQAISIEPTLPTTKFGLLQDNTFRNRVMNSLMEFQTFYQVRLNELQSDGGVTYVNQFAHTKSILLQQQSTDLLNRYLKCVEKVLETLNSPQLQQLLLIKESGRYLDRLVASFTQKNDHIAKLNLLIEDMENKNSELMTLVGNTYPLVESLIKSTKKLQYNMENSLKEVFQGFTVNITGEINQL